MLRAIKDYFRRRQLTRRGIVRQLSLPTYSAGARSGVWTVWPEGLSPDSVVYSFGVGDNLAWELALVERFGLTVHAFDPTPASVAWVGRQALPPQLRFHPTGLAGHDGTASFDLLQRGSRFNYRPLPEREHSLGVVKAPVSRLATHLRRLGHDHLDVLKLDIEGGESEALHDLLASRIPVGQLLVEFHHHFPGVGVGATTRALAALERAGYRIFHISNRGLEVCLLHVPSALSNPGSSHPRTSAPAT